MTEYTIITTAGAVEIHGQRWTRSDTGDVYVYDVGDQTADPVLEVDATEFIGIFDADHGRYVAAE